MGEFYYLRRKSDGKLGEAPKDIARLFARTNRWQIITKNQYNKYLAKQRKAEKRAKKDAKKAERDARRAKAERIVDKIRQRGPIKRK